MGPECLKTRFPRPTLLYAVLYVKLKNIINETKFTLACYQTEKMKILNDLFLRVGVDSIIFLHTFLET